MGQAHQDSSSALTRRGNRRPIWPMPLDRRTASSALISAATDRGDSAPKRRYRLPRGERAVLSVTKRECLGQIRQLFGKLSRPTQSRLADFSASSGSCITAGCSPRRRSRSIQRTCACLLPAALDDRLRHLVQLAEEAAELRTTSAAELLAALIWAQPLDGDHLAATITAYRQTGRDTIEAVRQNDQDPPRSPGRGRPRRSRFKNNPRAGGASHELPGEPRNKSWTSDQGEPDRQ